MKSPDENLLNFHLQDVARRVLSYKAWAYYSSAGDDEISKVIPLVKTMIFVHVTSASPFREHKSLQSNLFPCARPASYLPL